ncbi:MAG: hypothetical protein M3N05_05745 [Pseudomonadota bacterium]|nr:hypothetical protein [Pseudomonadota bacterium]
MVLTRADDYPIHQTAEPIAYAGTDRNFYDRYFFNGYSATQGDKAFFAAAFGVYPHLNIADAAFVVVRDGVEIALHASRWLNMERMDLTVGPIAIEVVEPLKVLRLIVDSHEHRIKADITFTARAEPIEEPRFIRRNGPRTFMDYTRLTQNGRYTGWIEVDGVRESVDGFVGTRDRSWGVRPVGARAGQDLAPPVAPQFFWLWSPTNFEAGSFFFHTNDDEKGAAWNRRAVWQPDGHPGRHIDDPEVKVEWKSGTRQAASATVTLGTKGQQRVITYTPVYEFLMLGLGYTHPKWSHGLNHGALAVEREDIVLKDVDVRMPHHLHVQALCDVTYSENGGPPLLGRGVFEQLAIGPHAPSGFEQMLDMAK